MGISIEEITRDKVSGLVQEARQQKKSKEAHVRKKLLEEFPGLEDAIVVRNGHVYKVLDYLVLDLNSYGNEDD